MHNYIKWTLSILDIAGALLIILWAYRRCWGGGLKANRKAKSWLCRHGFHSTALVQEEDRDGQWDLVHACWRCTAGRNRRGHKYYIIPER